VSDFPEAVQLARTIKERISEENRLNGLGRRLIQ